MVAGERDVVGNRVHEEVYVDFVVSLHPREAELEKLREYRNWQVTFVPAACTVLGETESRLTECWVARSVPRFAGRPSWAPSVTGYSGPSGRTTRPSGRTMSPSARPVGPSTTNNLPSPQNAGVATRLTRPL
ncbi:hypothetical protein J8273_7563 [Carpediemonas membranifera]|uniref:Uncharacterized protein n=1 Tax=Carpediemonas membranifera TaxID=201153 RepID=A0A8J6B029_9EUKA|nr:hypothetical protein J8273_7563 [Carpediemonas membranifera]|eukprot:KAG9391354.1 hypothetical protein J8273_7563 [Carpediemonas membranifera]